MPSASAARPESRPLAAYGWMSLAAMLFALMNLFTRMASIHAPWTMIAAARALVGVVVAASVAKARGVPLFVREGRGVMWLRSVFGTLSMAATFYALSSHTLPLGDTACLLSLAPVFVAALAPALLGERTGRRLALALGCSLAGVVLVLRPAALFGGVQSQAETAVSAGPGPVETAGVAMVAAFLSAFAMIMLRRVGQRENPEAIALHFSLVATAGLGVASIATLRPPSAADAGLMFLAGISGGFAQLALTRAYSLDRAARVGAVGYLSVVASALLGTVALHERPREDALAGIALVIASGVTLTLSGHRDARNSEPSRESRAGS
jgi:drug/metabolite transporter (DMT)-like permease